tara:strand:- start:313 stop:417 length:105 start_codon:yes stop_codon:yes gene_type:complete
MMITFKISKNISVLAKTGIKGKKTVVFMVENMRR